MSGITATPETTSLAFFGGALDTGNLGVAALGTALIEGAHRCLPDARVTVFDNSWGQRGGELKAGNTTLAYRASGARISRRLHQPETLQTMYTMARFGGLGNPGVKILREASATLDVSGGDSFTDMYGEKTFRAIVLPKLLARRAKSPLILLPQTFGPFYEPKARDVAADLTRGAHAAWARDAKGFGVLQELLGSDFDKDRHRQGVDMAFALTPTEPQGEDAAEVREWLAGPGPVAGINVSGLLVGAKPMNMKTDELAIDYEQAMRDIMRRFLEDSDARLLMVPHVNGTGIAEESDNEAVLQLVRDLGEGPERIRTVPADRLTANEAKWWIKQCDWFCGTRMHSTIAALSAGVPSAAVAYSLKTKPVFATVGQQDHVVDARDAESTQGVVDHLWASWNARDEARASLVEHLPNVLRQATEQMDSIMGMCRDLAAAKGGAK